MIFPAQYVMKNKAATVVFLVYLGRKISSVSTERYREESYPAIFDEMKEMTATIPKTKKPNK